MEGQFYFYLILQCLILSVLLLAARVSKSRPHTFFSPISWFTLFYLLVFLIPQFYMPSLSFPLIWTDRQVLINEVGKIVLTQSILILFLISFSVAYLLTIPKMMLSKKYVRLSSPEFNFASIVGLVGLAATLFIIVAMDVNNPRSAIVSTIQGKLAYAGTYCMTLGFLVVAATCVKNKKFIWLLIIAAIFAGLLFQLGGRGRVLWPFVSLFSWASLTGNLKLNIPKVAIAAIILGIILQGMDPLLLYLRDLRTADTAWQEFNESLSISNFFFARTFDAFHNLAIVVNKDEIEHSWSYMFSGSQAVFMREYFPDVQRGGVGFPATMPGGLWIASGRAGVIVGGAAFGLLFGLITKLYNTALHRESDLIVYVMAMPVLANIGTSWLDSYLKMFALIFPGLILVIKARLWE